MGGQKKPVAVPGTLRLAESMRIERWEPGDAAALRACHEVWRAARKTDDPLGSPKSARVLGAWLTHGFSGHPGEVWLVPGNGAGTPVVAWYRLGLPDRENRESALLSIVVHPDHRRRGLGTGLLRHATRRARAHDRTRLAGEARENGAGEAFADRQQAVRGITEVRRVLDVTAIPDGHLRRLRDEATPRAAGYTLVTWTGATPATYQAPVAAAHAAMNDAPHNPGFEPRTWDAERVREMDARTAEFGFRGYSVAAIHDGTGEAAAITEMYVDPEEPGWAHQGVTAVPGPHRGHRLGLLVKVAMLQWLAEAEPQIRQIDTGNAGSNRHMIAINEALGFRVHGPGWVTYDKTISAERIVAPA
jgi:RimJ/RimL family protein N-acetyltransferase